MASAVSRAALILAPVALAFAFVGQVNLAAHSYVYAAAAITIGLTAWFAAFRFGAPPVPAVPLGAADPAPSRDGKWRRLLLPISFVLSALTFLTSTHNTFTPLNVSLWFGSIATLVLAAWEWGVPRGAEAHSPRKPFRLDWRLPALAAVLILAGFFYYYQLDRYPAEMTSDHAEKLTDIHDVLNGARPIFFPRNTGREALEFYLVSAFIVLVHHALDFMALKWVMATIGLLVAPLTFLLARELFDDLTALFAAAFVGINLWGVGIARMGLRFAFTPFFTALTFLFLVRAFKYQRRNDYILTGLALGAGLYGYHAFKIVPLVVAGCFLLWLLLEGRIRGGPDRRAPWGELRPYLDNVALVVLISLVVFMPFLRYMTEHPDAFWYRVLTRVSSEEHALPGNPAAIFADNMKNALLMFNVEGDRSWPNTLSDVPVLDQVSGGLFLLGVAYALYRLVRRREMGYVYILFAMVGMLLPSALAIAFPIENPSVVRAGGAIPFVFILTALPLAQLVRLLYSTLPRPGLVLTALVPLLVIAMSAQLNYTRYFVLFDEQYRADSWNSSEIAGTMLEFVREGGSADHTWVVAYPYWVDTRNVAIDFGNIEWNNVVWHVKDIPDPSNDPQRRLYVLSPEDKPNLGGLHALFPRGQAMIFHSRTPGKEYMVFYVPGLNESGIELPEGTNR